MASWIILATFVVIAIYLIIHSRNFSGLPLVASIATAMLMCFFGFLFTAAMQALMTRLGNPIENSLIQSLLISLGACLGLTIRHYWKRGSTRKS